MTADFSEQASDRYIIGQYAYWAGDYDYAQQCYADVAGRAVTVAAQPTKQQVDDSQIENLRQPDGLLAYVADRRERRIAERRNVFSSLAKALPDNSQGLVPQPLILDTPRLRGAVWRLGARDFEKRAYVSAVKHSKHVLKRAKLIADARGAGAAQQVAPAKSQQPLSSTPVYEWEEPGNPFLTITVTRLMFIEVTAFWTGKKLPGDFTPIQERLQAVLDELSQ